MRFTIKMKLGLAFGTIIALLLGCAIYAVISLGTINSAMQAMTDGPVARLELVQRIKIEALQSIRQQKNMLLATTPAEVQSARSKGDEARVKTAEALDHALSIASEEGRPKC